MRAIYSACARGLLPLILVALFLGAAAPQAKAQTQTLIETIQFFYDSGPMPLLNVPPPPGCPATATISGSMTVPIYTLDYGIDFTGGSETSYNFTAGGISFTNENSQVEATTGVSLFNGSFDTAEADFTEGADTMFFLIGDLPPSAENSYVSGMFTSEGCGYESLILGTWSISPLGGGMASLGSGMTVVDAGDTASSPANPDDQGPQSNPGTLCEGCTMTGEPVNASDGNEFETQTDFAGGPSTGMSLTRYYNSQDSSQTPFGTGWRDAWHRGLIDIQLNGVGSTVTAVRADGRQDVFTENADGSWSAAPNVTSHLTALMNGSALTGWQLTLADDTVENYLPNGQLFSIVTRAGLATTLTYNSANDLAFVTGPFGHVMSFAYDTASPVHRVTGVTAPDGSTFAYAYDTDDNLISVTYPGGTARQYVYENTAFPNALTGIIDEDGNRYVTIACDSQGRATSTQFAGGADLTTLTYNSDDSTSVTDANGNTYTQSFTDEFGVMNMSTLTGAPEPNIGGSAFTYDANGFLASKTDYDGNVTTYIHDALGNELSRTEASGTSLARTYSATWLPNYHLPSLITEPNGRTTGFAYDAHGNLLTKTVTAGSETRVWQYTYNAQGQVLTATDPDGNVTTYTYDAKGDIASVTDALGHKTLFTSYDGAGRLLGMTDPNGLVTTMTYDPRGRILTRNVGGETTSFTYDAAGNLIQLTMPDGSYKLFTYDQAHRLTHVHDALGNRLAFSLDGNGNTTAAAAYDPSGNLDQTRSFAYDSVNRLTAEIGAQGQTTTYAHDPQGNLLSATDPVGDETQFGYDVLNRRIASLDAIGSATGYAYDIVDRLIAETDPRNLTTGYGYDGLDDQTSTSSPDAGNTARTFDAAGNVLTSTDARGDTTVYSYDRLNRVTEALYADGTKSLYQYDQGQYGIGHLTTMTDPSGSTSYSYDQHGRVTEKAQDTGNVRLITRYAYDSAGRLADITYPSGRTVSLTYDAAGDVNGLFEGKEALIANVAYRPFGPAETWEQGNGENLTRSFDLDGRIVSIAGGGLTLAYGYDAANRITVFDDTGYANQTFGYDTLDRLTGFAEGTNTTTYSYDADGNRLDLADSNPLLSTAYGIASNSNRLLSDETGTGKEAVSYAYGYDAAGNMLEEAATEQDRNFLSLDPEHPASRAFTYDARGRMASVETEDGNGIFGQINLLQHRTDYAINGLGERVAKSGTDAFGFFDAMSGAVEYAYDEAGHLIGEYDARGNVIEETVWLGDIPVTVMAGGFTFDGFGFAGDNDVYYITSDNLGAPHIITDAHSRKVWEWHHAPFGDTEPVSLGGFAYNLRFPGQVRAQESGTDYNMFRDNYFPGLGRYGQPDLLGLAGGQASLYGYVAQNPLTNSDVFGLDPSQICPLTQNSIISTCPFRAGTPINLPRTFCEMTIGLPCKPLLPDNWPLFIACEYGTSYLCSFIPNPQGCVPTWNDIWYAWATPNYIPAVPTNPWVYFPAGLPSNSSRNISTP